MNQDNDSVRKDILKAALLKAAGVAPHSRQKHYLEGVKKQAPSLEALITLYECEEALDVLIAQKNSIVWEGNHAADALNMDSLKKYSLQLEQPEG